MQTSKSELRQATDPTSGNSFALGFKSLDHEVSVPQLPVQGKFPPWLTGTLLRVAPCKYDLGRQTVNHWFDGLAMLHKFSFAQGYVSYANRFLHSDAFQEATKTGGFTMRGFATDPCGTLFQRVLSKFTTRWTDNSNVNVSYFARQAVALTETRMPVRFDPDTLETLGHAPILPDVKGVVTIAHPHYDRDRDCLYSYLLDFGMKSRYRLFSIDNTSGAQKVVAELKIDRPAYMHSFGMSSRYLVLVEFPLVVHPLSFIFRCQPFIRNYRWRPERGLRFHVFEKEGGRRVKTVEAESVFAFHHVNAYEKGDELIVDFVAHHDAGIIDQLYLARLRAGEPIDPGGRPMRYRIPLGASSHVRREVLSDTRMELPRIDYGRTAGRCYRTVWGAGTHRPGNFIDSIVKVNVENGQTLKWWEEDAYPGEPVFVADPNSQNEDTGVLVSVVLDARRNRSFLLVLDATSLVEVARAECPHPIPFGFHGNYYPAAANECRLPGTGAPG
ncbi:MAG: carotenoid oxygenase family protein [Planctomycetes bacterium]|nr:carotenoid oxygenase family protein [Planctomycetota bacterium]